MKKNSTAHAGSTLFLTKPLGIGILTTAEKKRQLRTEHQGLATEVMCRLNTPGVDFAQVMGITAMTDITSFGLLGHLSEVCQSSGLWFEQVPRLPGIEVDIAEGCVPGGSGRNFDSYVHLVSELQRKLLCNPQTSGGLLLAVMPEVVQQVQSIAERHGIQIDAIGELHAVVAGKPLITVE